MRPASRLLLPAREKRSLTKARLREQGVATVKLAHSRVIPEAERSDAIRDPELDIGKGYNSGFRLAVASLPWPE
jgi:hypothetical protein